MMDIREFGDALIRTGDLDPVYVGIYSAKLPEAQLCRLLLAYWCFYHLGAAAWISEHEGAGFWGRMLIAARNELAPKDHPDCPNALERWPRGAERRHFRGSKCVDAVQWFAQAQPTTPETWVRLLYSDPGYPSTEKEIMGVITSRWPMFGPWIAFKAADMLERCAGQKITFDRNVGLMYAEPRAALDLLNRAQVPGQFGFVGAGELGIYDKLLTYFGPRSAPPALDRGCGPQEVETILCKWKSMSTGHYWVGKDTHEVREALAGWGETAGRMLGVMPSEVPAQEYA